MKKLKTLFNESVLGLTKLDILIIIIITLGYSILSFINLGSFSNPQTFYTLQKDEEITYSFRDLEDVIRLRIYNGEQSGRYDLSVSSDNENYTYLREIEAKGSFSWLEEKVLKRVKYVKLKALDDKSRIGEVAFYNNTKNMIKIISTKALNQQIYKTIDEQDKVPETISYLNSSYFDEVYFARTAYDYYKNYDTYEWTHPPLGKLIQAIPIKISNTMAPFFYRLMGNIAGILMVPLMYLFALKLFKKRKYAVFSSLLMFFDCFHFAHTRMATVDSFLVLFVMLSFYFMYVFITKNKIRNLLLSGLFFGLSISVKWTGFLAGLGLAIIYFINMLKQKDNKTILKLIVKGFTFFIVIPSIIYISLYLIFPRNKTNETTNIKSIIKQQETMYKYHANLKSTHYFSSSWYTWPISYKPVWYYNKKVDDYNRGTITGVGNVAIWWAGAFALIYLLVATIIKKKQDDLFILLAILSMWLPYMFIGRVMFLYHFFPVLPFIMLAITKLFKDITECTNSNKPMIIYTCIVILVFIIFYPVISGTIVNNNYIDSLKLLKSWYF